MPERAGTRYAVEAVNARRFPQTKVAPIAKMAPLSPRAGPSNLYTRIRYGRFVNYADAEDDKWGQACRIEEAYDGHDWT